MDLPWWFNWFDIVLMGLTAILGPMSGLWNILEGMAGKEISRLLKGHLLAGVARGALQMGVQKIVTALRQEVDKRVGAKAHIFWAKQSHAI